MYFLRSTGTLAISDLDSLKRVFTFVRKKPMSGALDIFSFAPQYSSTVCDHNLQLSHECS